MSDILDTKVVNLTKEPCDVKICRKNGKIESPPNEGCFGNPFTVKEYGREGCIERYKKYFECRIKNDSDFREAILSLKGKVLGCFCKPLDCHGDIIKEWLDNEYNIGN